MKTRMYPSFTKEGDGFLPAIIFRYADGERFKQTYYGKTLITKDFAKAEAYQLIAEMRQNRQ